MELCATICNRSLNIQEQCAVKASLVEIKLNEKFKSTRFWGKIFGVQNDYLIIEATTVSHQIVRKYFFSIDGGLRFAQLPIVEPWMKAKCMQIASLFTGVASYVYPDTVQENEANDASDQAPEQEQADEQDQAQAADDDGDEPPNSKLELSELDRLAWTVNKISDECHIVPKSSVLLTSSKIMQANKNFVGLSRNDAAKLCNYFHFRTPRSPYAVSQYRKSAAMNDTSFLDSITDDLPNGCWALKAKQCGRKIDIYNLLWSGFQFKYNVGETQFVQAYFGDGIRRNDLVFMI